MQDEPQNLRMSLPQQSGPVNGAGYGRLTRLLRWPRLSAPGRRLGLLVVIALCALFTARAAGKVAGTLLAGKAAGTFPGGKAAGTFPGGKAAGTFPGGTFPGGKAAGTFPESGIRTAEIVVTRNLFCSDCQSPGPAEPPLAAAAPALQLEHLELVVTLLSEEDPAWSFAAIRDTRTDEIGLFGVGSRLPAGALVVGVHERQVTVEQGSMTGHIALQPLASERAAVSSPLLENLVAGVRKVDEGRYVIERELVRKLARAPDLARWARIVPRVDGQGQPTGFTLYRIHPDSIFALLGLRDGDAIRAVNGRPLTAELALSLYSGLQSTSQLQLSFERRGKPMTYDFTIQ